MAVRNDLSIDWSQSPRIITVAAPSTEITMQDLYDTLRTLEAGFDAVDEDSIVSAGGGEQLGGGTKVGLTITLLNALLAFEARSGPSFVQCNISGGNLVAQDSVGSYFTSPVYPTSYTQVILANSSSATQSDLAAIQYSSFQNKIWVDEVNGTSGTSYPVGTPQYPVSNWADAIIIAQSRGFNAYQLLGNADIDAGIALTNSTIYGQNANLTFLVLDPDAYLLNCEFQEATITGTLDGGCIIRNSVIFDLDYVYGFVFQTMLAPGIIRLGGTPATQAHFLNCFSGVPGSVTPTIDCAGDGPSLSVRNYAGGLKLINKTGAAKVSIDLASGQVKLDLTTVTSGEIVVRGIGKVIEATTGEWLGSGTYGGVTLINETNFGVMLQELWALQGLDVDNPMTVTPTSRIAGLISQIISGDGTTTSTITRQ